MKKKLPKKFISKPKVVEIQKSPSIFRSIPDIHFPSLPLLPEKELVIGFVCGCLMVGILFSVYQLVNEVKVYQGVLQERKAFLQQKTYWYSVTKQFPNYRDAHFRLGVLAYQEGNMAAAKEEITKSLELDPSFIEGKMFLDRLKK